MQVFREHGLAIFGADWRYHPKIVTKTADETVNNSNTLQNDDELLFAIGASEIWVVDAVLYLVGKAAADVKFKATVPTSSAGNANIRGNAGSESAVDATITHSLSDDSVTSIGCKWLVVASTTAGNFQLQWAQNAADATNLTMKIGSHLVAHRLK